MRKLALLLLVIPVLARAVITAVQLRFRAQVSASAKTSKSRRSLQSRPKGAFNIEVTCQKDLSLEVEGDETFSISSLPKSVTTYCDYQTQRAIR